MLVVKANVGLVQVKDWEGYCFACAEPLSLSGFAAQTVHNSFPLLVYGCLIWEHLWKQMNEEREGQV